jgi:stringent starvation protein B
MTDAVPEMGSNRPYLLRALNEWINDNGMTPYLLVDAGRDGVQVPMSAVKDGRVVLNIAPRAVAQLVIDNREVRFKARFGGVSQSVVVPVAAVLAIYDGAAMPDDTPDPTPPTEGSEPPRRSHLRVIK